MSVYLDFLGAAGEVTGSKTILEIDLPHQKKPLRVMIDCGLHQGASDSRAKNWNSCEPDPESVSAIILTHAHLDHSGLLPRYCKGGYRGPIYCTSATAEIGKILLLDAAFLEEETASYARRTGYSRHKNPQPLFTEFDANIAIDLFKPVPRHKWNILAPGVSFQLLQAGHIIGASMVQFAIEISGQTKLVTFSGDLGNERSATMRPPEDLVETDVLILESTYGSRNQPRIPADELLAETITNTVTRKGVVVIPAFAVGRTQEILYMIRQLEDQKAIPIVPVVLDSPMARAATKSFIQHPEDHKLATGFNGGFAAFLPHEFELTHSTNESMATCLRDGPLIVISASGMLSGGRILHHLKSRLPNPKNTVLFVGYQAEGSKGRYLIDHGKNEGRLRIFHEEIPVEAEIRSLENLSAHADQQDLLQWVSRIHRKPARIFLNHGTETSTESLAKALHPIAPEARVTIPRNNSRFKIF